LSRRRLLAMLLPLALAACQTGPRAGAPYRADRLPTGELAALVEAPLAQIESGEDEAGVAAFEAMLAQAERRHGVDSLQKADLLTAFGVSLHSLGETRYSEAALLYLRRATEAYRAYFGPGHPEVAIALNSWADVERGLRPHLPAAAEAALDEAYGIRLAALGPAHRETVWTILYLARVRSRLAWTRAEPARLASVSADLDRAIELSRGSDADTASAIPVVAELFRAILFARHGRPAAAIAAWQASQAAVVRSPSEAACAARSYADDLLPLLDGPELAGKLAPVMRAEQEVERACAAAAWGAGE
jgi:hypothetical protein